MTPAPRARLAWIAGLAIAALVAVVLIGPGLAGGGPTDGPTSSPAGSPAASPTRMPVDPAMARLLRSSLQYSLAELDDAALATVRASYAGDPAVRAIEVRNVFRVGRQTGQLVVLDLGLSAAGAEAWQASLEQAAERGDLRHQRLPVSDRSVVIAEQTTGTVVASWAVEPYAILVTATTEEDALAMATAIVAGSEG